MNAFAPKCELVHELCVRWNARLKRNAFTPGVERVHVTFGTRFDVRMPLGCTVHSGTALKSKLNSSLNPPLYQRRNGLILELNVETRLPNRTKHENTRSPPFSYDTWPPTDTGRAKHYNVSFLASKFSANLKKWILPFALNTKFRDKRTSASHIRYHLKVAAHEAVRTYSRKTYKIKP